MNTPNNNVSMSPADRAWLEEKLGRMADQLGFLCEHVRESDKNLAACKVQCTSSLEEIFRRVGALETVQAINTEWIKDHKDQATTRAHTQATWWHTYGVWATLGLMFFGLVVGLLLRGPVGIEQMPSPHHPPHIQQNAPRQSLEADKNLETKTTPLWVQQGNKR